VAGRRVVILGAGVGGLVAARRLRRLLPATDQVIVADREADSLFAPSLPWLVSGARTARGVQRPLARLLKGAAEVVRGEIQEIDPAARRATVGDRSTDADALIIALGADLAPEALPGLASAGHNLYKAAGAVAMREAVSQIRGGRVVLLTATPAYKCPAAPYEMVMLIDDLLRRSGLRHSVQLDMIAAEPAPMPAAGEAVGVAVKGLLESKGIGYHPSRQVKSVDPARRTLRFNDDAEERYDLLGFVPPHRAPATVAGAGLTAASGWIAVDRGTLETAHPGVFAIGDVNSIPLTSGRPLPKAGVFAHRQAEVVAKNLAHAWTGRGTPARFDGHGACFVEVGNGRAAYGGGDFFAEPAPRIRLRRPTRLAHWGKALYERLWLSGFLVGLPD
jgi:sulfide:quinone oxidoreductase